MILYYEVESKTLLKLNKTNVDRYETQKSENNILVQLRKTHKQKQLTK